MALTGNTFFFPWEVSLIEWLQTNLSSSMIRLVSSFSMFGEELMLILIVGFVYWSYDKKLGKTIGLSGMMGLIFNTMIKNIAMRRRPYFDHEGIKFLRVVDPEANINDIASQGYSFPSAHSTSAASVYGSIANSLRKRWMTVIAVILSLLTGFSRIVVGAHYPTDVLVGWLLGIVTVAVISLLQKRIESTLKLYGILLLVAIPGIFFYRSTDYFSGLGLLIGFMGGTLLDDYCVNFENTRRPLWMVLRIIGGLVIFLVLNTALKMPFSKEFLSSGSTAALLVRCARYAIIAFVEFGVYPMLFRLEKKAA